MVKIRDTDTPPGRIKCDLSGDHEQRGRGVDSAKILVPYERGIEMSRKSTKSRVERIREDLMQYISDQGMYGEYLTDLVDDYCSLWEVKEMLIADIKKRGVAIEWKNSETSKGKKKNDSVGELTKINMQMIKILNQLNISPKTLAMTGGDADDEEDF